MTLCGDWPEVAHELDDIVHLVQECEQKIAEITLKAKELLNDVDDDEPEEFFDDEQEENLDDPQENFLDDDN